MTATITYTDGRTLPRGLVIGGCEIEIRHIGDGPDLVNLCADRRLTQSYRHPHF